MPHKNRTLKFLENARDQILLMKENDYTLAEKVLRIRISGKECDGFRYQIGFTEKRAEDIIVETNVGNVHLDAFSAFYLEDVSIDYLFDPRTAMDGFQVTNHKEELYHGKFYEDQEMMPDIVVD